jgi:FAD/FMN-containing dehydrogenase/Fe-S oxidoreductase
MGKLLGDSALAARLREVMRGEVLFDAFTRGRYSTDASIYQIEPIGVALPQGTEDVIAAIALARQEGFPVIPRGGGSSQNGQPLGEAVVMDTSRHMNRVLEIDAAAGTATVQPGIVLDELNRQLKATGWQFPVDVSTSAHATLGGMTGNNSAGTRSIKYGLMVHNVLEVEAVLADASRVVFGELPADATGSPPMLAELAAAMRALHAEHADEIALRIPKVLRRVGGYNIDALGGPRPNLAQLLVGSEGTLGFFTRIKLKLSRIPRHKVGAVCHFARFFDAMDMTRFIVELAPTAVEVVDRKMMELARRLPVFRATLERHVKGAPDAILLVEFAGDEQAPLLESLQRLEELLADHGHPGSVVRLPDAASQAEMTAVRKAGLNIMMSMKGDGKPISFIEDCAVALPDLAEFTERLTRLFAKYGTEGTWYAHASVGCLHVRPILNMKDESGARKMRAIAEEAFAIVKEYRGSHSGEHGDGLSRSEFHTMMFGERIVRAFESVKDAFDPQGLLNPGKIVRAPRMDDRSLFRYKPGYAALKVLPALDWSESGGRMAATEMCNNNGSCRKFDAVMCPSYQATGDERDATRGRANSLRLALSGQLGPDALVSESMKETMDLCVGCKACRRECPTGVDMSRMKIEFLHHWNARHGVSRQTKLTAYLPRYAAIARRFAPLVNLRNRVPALAALGEKLTGLSRKRKLPAWRSDIYTTPPPRLTTRAATAATKPGNEVVLFVDCFSRYFEPENAHATRNVLEAGRYTVLEEPTARPLCCGRTFLSAGLVDEARVELTRLVAALGPHAERGVPIVGIEPSCLLTLRDELPVVVHGDAVPAIVRQAVLLEEFLAAEHRRGTLALAFRDHGKQDIFLHGHCHQKALGAMPDVVAALGLVPGVSTHVIESSCCGMAGAFGYEKDHYDISLRMADKALLPAVRGAPPEALIVADGTSCRHQIADGTGRPAVHVARVLEAALEPAAAMVPVTSS